MKQTWKKIKCHTRLEIFFINDTNQRGQGVMFQSFSEAKNAEEEKKLIKNATPKSTRAVKK